ncbi:MAG: hypothetical protein ACI9ND_000361 [Yoonia sp.]|jgi:hypothetical protein
MHQLTSATEFIEAGPDYKKDYTGCSKVGDHGCETYSKTENRNQLSIRLPDETGEHKRRNVLRRDGVLYTPSNWQVHSNRGVG